MSLIECRNLYLSYGKNTVVRNVNISIQPEDYLYIIGQNGSGKSTLVKALVGLKNPSSGEIIKDKNLRIGYLPQQSAIQRDFPASSYEVVLSGCLNELGIRPFYTKKHREKAMKNMHRLGIADLKRCCYRDLSGGQQQRILLARALCASDEVLLLDEPVSGLDPMVTMQMYNLIKELNEKEHYTVIMVSHDMHAAYKNASKILHLHHEVLFFGRCEEYKQSKVARTFGVGGFECR